MIGVFMLLLLLIFPALLVVTFSMILHGVWSPEDALKMKGSAAKAGLFFYPFLLWILVGCFAEWFRVPVWYTVVFYYLNLLLSIILVNVSYALQKGNKLFQIPLILNLLNGAFLVLLLMVFHFNLD